MAKSKKEKTRAKIEEFKALHERRKPLESKWINYYKKLYMYKELSVRELNDIKRGIKSDIRLPRYISNNEVKRPRIISNLWAHNPIVKAVLESQDAFESYKIYEFLVNKYMRENLYVPFDLALSQMLYLGTGCYMMELDQRRSNGVTMDQVNFRFCDMFNTYVPDSAVCRKDIDVVYRRFLKKRSYLKKQEAKGYYKDINKVPALDAGDEKIVNNAYTERMAVLGLEYGSEELGASYGASKEEEDRDDIIEVVEKWTPETKVTIANRTVEIKEEGKHQYGFLPFYFIRNYRNDGMFYGMGEVEVMGGIPSYMDEMKNMRMDIIRRVAYPAALIARNARIPKEDLIPKPMQIIRTFDMDGYREVQRPDVKRILVDEEFIGKQDTQDATGHWSYLAGGPAPRAETATTALTMKEAGMERINTVLFFMCKDAIEPTAYDMANLIKKKFKNGAFIDMSSFGELPNPKEIKGEQLMGNVSWTVSAFELKTVADVNDQQNMLAMFRELRESSRINQFELERQLLETFGIKNLDEMLVKGPKEKILALMDQDQDFAEVMAVVAKNPELSHALKAFIARALQGIGVEKKPDKETDSPEDHAGQPKSPSPGSGAGIPAGSAAPTNMRPYPAPGGGDHIGRVQGTTGIRRR